MNIIKDKFWNHFNQYRYPRSLHTASRKRWYQMQSEIINLLIKIRVKKVILKILTLKTFDRATFKILMTILHSWLLICSSSALNLAISCLQCSNSAKGPVSSASFLIWSLSAKIFQYKILHTYFRFIFQQLNYIYQ